MALFNSCLEKQKTIIEKPIVKLSETDKMPGSAFWVTNNGKENWFNVDWMHNHKNIATISIFDKTKNHIITSSFMIVCPSDEIELMNNLKTQIDYFDGQNIQLKSNCYLMNRKLNE